MSPALESRLRGMRWLLLLSIGAVLLVLFLDTPEPEITLPPVQTTKIIGNAEKEWLYVTTNSVLLFPVVGGECRTTIALGQVHKSTKVLVIARQGEWVEVEQENKAAVHAHGCIHKTVLEKRK